MNDDRSSHAILQSHKENDLKSHWDRAYENAEVEQLGWFEEVPEPSLRLIQKCNLDREAHIFNAGAGATTLIEALLEQGFENITVNDISSSALNKLKLRLEEDEKEKVHWILDDLTTPTILNQLHPVDLWHDRAVLHFFTENEEQHTYFELLKKLVKPNGFVIIAAFNLNGAEKCSGLPVFRYDENMLQEKLGDQFQLVEAFDYTYFMPGGDSREYVYTLFRRKIDF